MISAEIKEKYIGLQTRLKERSKMLACMGDYSCLFLCLCSIAEEWFWDFMHFERMIDIIRFAEQCRKEGCIDDEWTCQTEKILRQATGLPWKKNEVKELPPVVPDEMYTVEKWFNPRTGKTHFRRRWGDTLENSVTVKEGQLVGYYTFTCLGLEVR